MFLFEKLQMDSKLKLEKVQKSARQKEAIKCQRKQLTQGGHDATLAGLSKGSKQGGHI